jgi:hypothetical protein
MSINIEMYFLDGLLDFLKSLEYVPRINIILTIRRPGQGVNWSEAGIDPRKALCGALAVASTTTPSRSTTRRRRLRRRCEECSIAFVLFTKDAWRGTLGRPRLRIARKHWKALTGCRERSTGEAYPEMTPILAGKRGAPIRLVHDISLFDAL